MKKLVRIFYAFVFFHSGFAWSHGEGGTARIGPAFAIQAVKEDVGFQLSSQAKKFMGVQFSPWIPGTKISAKSCVMSLESSSIYVLRDGWIQRIELRSNDCKTGNAPAGLLQTGDQLVVEGIAAVRGADLEVTGGEDEEHEEERDHDGGDEHGPSHNHGHSHGEKSDGEHS
jgi:hypothetical protein